MKNDVNGISTTAPGTENYESKVEKGFKHGSNMIIESQPENFFLAPEKHLKIAEKKRDQWMKNES